MILHRSEILDRNRGYHVLSAVRDFHIISILRGPSQREWHDFELRKAIVFILVYRLECPRCNLISRSHKSVIINDCLIHFGPFDNKKNA